MKCSDYIEWISRRVDGSLPRDQFAELEEHLAVCARCRAEYRLQKKIIAALGQAEPSGLSPDFTKVVAARTLEIAEARRRAEKLEPLIPALVFAAAAIVLFIFRTQVAAAVEPGMDTLADVIGGPLARLGSIFAGITPSDMGVATDSTSFVQRVSQPVVVIGTAVALACASAVWAMRKAASLLRG
jgi:anti-sigma factor RsiW